MSDEKAKRKESLKDQEELLVTSEATVSTVHPIASSLAGVFLEIQVTKGRDIEIPSLGIKVGKANLRERNSSTSPDHANEKN